MAYCGERCQKSDWARHKNICKKNKFKVVQLESRGTAVVAMEVVEAGTKILEEEPVLVVRVPSSVVEARILLQEGYDEDWGEENPGVFRNNVCEVLVDRAVWGLEQKKQAVYRNMFDKNEPKTDMGIFLTNALPLGSYSLMGVFPIINRINHSCQPNCHVHWNTETNKEVLYVTSKLQIGTELTISYLDLLTQVPTKQGRQTYLSHHFHFTCSCILCSLTGTQLEEDDKVRLEAKYLADQVKEENMKNPETSLTLLNKIYNCFSSVPFPPATQWVFYASGFRLHCRTGDLKMAERCLKMAMGLLEMCKGRCSREFKLLEKEWNLVANKNNNTFQ